MNLLLLIYAMIAGLTGFTAGPSAVARRVAVAETGSIAPAAVIATQPSFAAKALTARAAMPVLLPTAPLADARRVAIALVVQAFAPAGRAAPERRLE